VGKNKHRSSGKKIVRYKPNILFTADEQGSILPLFALLLVVICAIASLALDVGVLYIDKQRVQAAADFGALSGADRLLQGAANAETVANDVASKNNPQALYEVSASTESNTVTVSGLETVPLWFARVFADSHGDVHGQATAEIGTLTGGTGMVPIAVIDQVFRYGEEVYLSAGAGQGQSGNYGFLDFSGSGANGLESDIEHGYDFSISVGEQVATEPGVMAGPVQTAIDFRMNEAANDASCASYETAESNCSRVMYLPVVDTLDVSGKKDVTIVGFAAFYLEGLVGNGGNQEILGRFIQMVRPGTIGIGKNYGTYGVKLIQ
jgi:hypothetical protein